MSTLVKFKSLLNNKKRSIKEGLASLQDQRREGAENYGSFFSNSHPNTISISNILNPLYLNNFQNRDKVFSHDYILARDGLFPLMDFFFYFVRPGRSGVILLIQEDLKFIIPKTWASNALTYKICKKFPSLRKDQLPRSLYLFTISARSNVRYQTFCQKIKKIKDFYGEKLHRISLKWITPLRNGMDPHMKKDILPNYLYILREILSQFGTDSKFYTWEEMVNNKDFHCSSYYHMNDDNFSYSYSYIDHFFLNKRCTPFDNGFDRDRDGEIVVDVSPEYEIHIKSFEYEPNDIWKEIIDMANSLNIAETLFNSEFFPHSWKIADRYLFKK